MFFRMSIPIPSLKWFLARFLYHGRTARLCCCTPDIGHRNCLECWRVLRYWVGGFLNDRTVNFCCKHPKLHIRSTIMVALDMQVLANVTVKVLYVVWFSRYSCPLFISISMVKNYENPLFDLWGSDPLKYSTTPLSIQGSYGNEY